MIPGMEKNEIGELVRAAREAAALSQAELAERVGAKQQTIDKIESGQTKFSRFFEAIERELNIAIPRGQTAPPQAENTLPRPGPGLRLAQPPDVSNVGFHSKMMPTGSPVYAGETRDFPIYSAAEGGKGILILTPEPVEWDRRPAPVAGVRAAYGIIVVGESMAPEFEPGDVALVNPTLPPRPNVTCVFYSEPPEGGSASATIKRLVRVTSDHWIVRQFNPEPGEKADFQLSRRDWAYCHRVIGRYAGR